LVTATTPFFILSPLNPIVLGDFHTFFSVTFFKSDPFSPEVFGWDSPILHFPHHVLRGRVFSFPCWCPLSARFPNSKVSSPQNLLCVDNQGDSIVFSPQCCLFFFEFGHPVPGFSSPAHSFINYYSKPPRWNITISCCPPLGHPLPPKIVSPFSIPSFCFDPHQGIPLSTPATSPIVTSLLSCSFVVDHPWCVSRTALSPFYSPPPLGDLLYEFV